MSSSLPTREFSSLPDLKRRANDQPKRRAFGLETVFLLLVVLYLVIPLIATLVFGLSSSTGFDLYTYQQILSDHDFSQTLLLSLGLALATTILAVVLVTPTAYWVQLRLPGLRPLLDFLSLVPFAVPPIVMSLGLLQVYGNFNWLTAILSLGLVPLLSNDPFTIVNTSPLLVCAYVIVSLPFVYRPIDNSLRAVNTRVLSEAASSLGSGWWRTFLTIVLPNIWPGVISAALLTFSTAMGEFTLAALFGIYTFPIYLNQVGQGDAHKAASLAILSFIITLICVLGIILPVQQNARRTGQKSEIEIGAAK
jgi:putative spermidine/putrescine transport system permease protein